MPKFYRQNRKRIDARYFLSETMDSSVVDKQKSFNTELLRIFNNRLAKIDDKLRKDNEHDPRRLPLNTLIKKVDDSRAGRDGLSDDEYNELDAAMKDESSLQAFNTRVLAMLDGMQSGVDTDSDGIPDEKELAIIDKGEI